MDKSSSLNQLHYRIFRGIILMLLTMALLTGNVFVRGMEAEEDWNCPACGTINEAQNNFCWNCGTARPQTVWICGECGHENDAKANFCVGCGAKKPDSAATETAEGQTETSNSDTAQSAYAYGRQILYWKDSVYVTGDDGIYRIKGGTEFDRLIGLDSVAHGFFAWEDSVYFIKAELDESSEFLYVYDTVSDSCEVLCSAAAGSSLIGADDGCVYFLQPQDSDYNGGSDLIRYHIAEDEKEIVASGIGTAQFWNGGIVISGAASDVSPVQLMMLGSDGNSGLIGENCSQSFYIDMEAGCLYYIKYSMTSDTSWNAASLCRLDQTGNTELFCIEGDYITPTIYGMVSGNILIAYSSGGTLQYFQLNSSDNTWGEMELPPGASGFQLFYDEYNNTYYYANDCIYVWHGSEYRKVADVASDGFVLGIYENMVYYWRYTYGYDQHPYLFQSAVSW